MKSTTMHSTSIHSTSMPSTSPPVTSLILFDNQASHLVFQDKSSLILHPDQKTITYFNKLGQRQQLSISNCRQSEGMYAKLLDALRLKNRYTETTNLLLPQICSEYDQAVKLTRITSCLFSLKKQLVHHDGHLLTCKSSDGMATISIDTRTLQVHLHYQQLLPKKKAIKNYDSQQSNFNFVTDFLDKYNLKDTQKQSDYKLELGYSYYFVHKEYSLYYYPPAWTYIVYQFYNILLDKVQHLNISFPQPLIDYITDPNHPNDNLTQCHFIQRYSCYKNDENALVICLPEKVIYDESLLPTQLSADDIPPANDFITFKNLRTPVMMHKSGISVWFQGMALGYMPQDESFIFRDGSYWHKVGSGEDQVWDYNSTIHDELKDIDIIFNHYQFKLRTNAQNPQQMLNTGELYNCQKGNFEVLREQTVLNVGHFLALQNGSIKARFQDRTIVSLIYPPPCVVSVLLGDGTKHSFNFEPQIEEEYFFSINYLMKYIPAHLQYYVFQCIKIAEECYVITEIQNKRMSHEDEVNGWIQSELDKSSRYLYITGKTEEPKLQMSIEELMKANAEMLQKLKSSN